MRNALNFTTIACCLVTIITVLSVRLNDMEGKEILAMYNHTTQVLNIYREKDEKTEIKCRAPYKKRNLIEQIELKKDMTPIAYVIHSPTDKTKSKNRRYSEEERIYIRYHQDHQTQVKVYKEYLTPHETAFETHLDYSGIYLTLNKTNTNNTGNYNCTIRYTTHEIVTEVTELEIFHPPGENIITDGNNNTIPSTYGHLRIGDDIKLRCRPSSGKPTPVVSWKIQNNKSTRRRIEIDTIEIKNLTREDHDKRLICYSSNSIHNKTFRKTTSTKLHMILPPTAILITQDTRRLRERTRHEFGCEVINANPTPRIKWKMNNRILEINKILPTSNSIIASLQITLLAKHHQIPLQCEVTIPGLTKKFKAVKIIRMEFKPKCERELTQVRINQGKENIGLTCPIMANPGNGLVVTWKGNGSVTDELKMETRIHINISNHADLQESIVRCSAENQIGKQEGNCLFQFKFTEECIFHIAKICITASRIEATKWLGIIVIIIILPISIKKMDQCIKKRHTTKTPQIESSERSSDKTNMTKHPLRVSSKNQMDENNGYMKMWRWTPDQKEEATTTTPNECNTLIQHIRHSDGECQAWQDLTDQLNGVMISLKKNKIETELIMNEWRKTEPDDTQAEGSLGHINKE